MLCFITSHQVLWAWIWGCTCVTRGQSRGILSPLGGRPWTSVRQCESGPLSLPLLSWDPHLSWWVWHHLAATAIWSPGRWHSRQVCVCVLGCDAWEGRQGWREWVPSIIWALGTPWGGRLGQLLPLGGPGCAGVSFANVYVCYFLCVSGKSCVSNFNLPQQDSF